MNTWLTGNSMWQLVKASDGMTWLVLLILLFMSIICWAIFFYKIILLRIKKQQMQQALLSFKTISTFEELRTTVLTMSHTLPGYFLKKNLSCLKSLLEAHPDRTTLSDKELQHIQVNVEQTLDDIMHNEESYISILFSSASISPLLGLFGTIWGLVHAFMRISEKQSADIATVAPGIAEALITTLAGLLVAIPALVMYHVITSQIKQIEHQFFKLSDKFIWLVQRLFS